MEKWNETKEWKEILELHKIRKISEIGERKLMEFYFNHKDLTLHDFEIEFRKSGSPFHMFAEDPQLTRFNKGFPAVNQDGEQQPYVFVWTTKDLKDCKNDFSEQCFDVEGNLERLKKTGYAKYCDNIEDLDNSFKKLFGSMNFGDEMIFIYEDIAVKFFEFLKKNPTLLWYICQSHLGFKLSDEIKKKFEEKLPKEFENDNNPLTSILIEYITEMGWIKRESKK